MSVDMFVWLLDARWNDCQEFSLDTYCTHRKVKHFSWAFVLYGLLFFEPMEATYIEKIFFQHLNLSNVRLYYQIPEWYVLDGHMQMGWFGSGLIWLNCWPFEMCMSMVTTTIKTLVRSTRFCSYQYVVSLWSCLHFGVKQCTWNDVPGDFSLQQRTDVFL